MLEAVAMPLSNSTSLSEEATPTPTNALSTFNPLLLPNTNLIKLKKKRNLPGNPDPDAEVIALSPKALLARNRFICEICKKGFQRDQNLQLHRRGHNLPWKLKQRNKDEVIRKKAYVCPESTCVHHHPSRALGDLTGIKKHFSRKHGEKKYKCDKCSKIYAVQSDWKAHSKICGTREYRCDCGTLFSRRDSFITHRAFCDALAQESVRLSSTTTTTTNPFSNPTLLLPPPPPPFSSSTQNPNSHLFPFSSPWAPPSQNPNSHLFPFSSPWAPPSQNPNYPNPNYNQIKTEINNNHHFSPPFTFQQPPPFATAHFLSATALLQKATIMGAVMGPQPTTHDDDQAALMEAMMGGAPHSLESLANATWQRNNDGFTRDFLGLAAGDHYQRGGGEGDTDHMIKFTGGLQYSMTSHYDGTDNSSSSSSVLLLKPDHQQYHQNHNQQVDDHDNDQGFGTFVTSSMEMESRWG